MPIRMPRGYQPIGGPQNGRPPTMAKGRLSPNRKARVAPIIGPSEGRRYLGKMRGNKPYTGPGRGKGL
jgi:hypothetical protein